MTKPLLPSGCYDVLPPHAARETALVGALLGAFEAHGYAQVNPPLLEYSDNLLAGRGAALSDRIFRVMDAEAGKVMGIRADMTLQLARLAATRLADAPRPLRLSYAGQVLRAKGESLSANRQLRQAGIELIGPTSAQADAEAIAVGARALAKAGIQPFSVDLHLPGVAYALLAEEKLEEQALQELLSAVSHKDASVLRRTKLREQEALLALVETVGDFAAAFATLQKAPLPPAVREMMARLEQVAQALLPLLPAKARLTLDATESRGFEYHHGISFSFFAPGVAREIGRGGRYRIENGGTHEEATGLTFYVDTLRHLLPAAENVERVYAIDASAEELDALQAQGYVTLIALPDILETPQELGCIWVWEKGELKGL